MKAIVPLIVSALWIVLPLAAQNNNATQDAQIKAREVNEMRLRDAGEAGFSDEDGDFGDLVPLQASKSWWVTPHASARGYWTSNALLTSKGEKGDTIFSESQGFNAGWRLNAELQLTAGYSYQLTRYAENPVLDTNAHMTDFNLTYKLPWNFQAGAGIRGLWLNSPHQKVEVYRENNPYATISQSFTYLENRLTLFHGYEYDHKFTNPVGFERDEHTVFLGTAYSWLPNLLTQAVLRQNLQMYDFRPSSRPVNGRQEWVSSVILQTVWQPLPWLQVSGFGLASYDNSVNSTRDYKVANAGGEVKFFWKF